MFKLLRRLYDWVLRWGDHPAGSVAMAVVAFVESSVFIIPPDPLLIALSLGKPKRSFLYAAICTVASVLGGIVGYLIGALIWSAVKDLFFQFIISQTAFDRVGGLYEQYNFWAVFVAGFTPIPYKIFTIAAGVFQISFVPFLIASVVGRASRFFLVALLIRFWGEKIRSIIEKHFNLMTVILTVMLIGGFVLFRFVF